MPSSKSTLYLLLAVALYAVAQLTWYLGTPLGQSPALDGQENLLLAHQIGSGTLPAEPFYRAMLYPWILSILPLHWAVIGLAAHLANTLLVIRIAARFWKHATGALIAGGLIGFNPVLLHFAFDPLDITLATTFFLVGLLCLQKAKLRQHLYSAHIGFAATAGVFLALAALARPHFMAILAPTVILLLVAAFRRRTTLSNALAFTGAAAVPLLAYGFVQASVGGFFGLLPWQGAYNLWASNKPGANGLYYQQSMEFHYTGEHRNPARLESEELYKQANGAEGSIADQTAFWRNKTLGYIAHHPFAWSKLMAFKLYAAFNNYEQYNNKTYSFHKKQSPWLRYNPIGWGLLLVGAVFACSTLWRQIKRDLTPALILSVCYLAGMLLYMASARFRVPLAPILAILCGGIPFAIDAIKVSSKTSIRRAAIATVAALAVSFSAFGSINAKDTYLQDMLLMADASANVGQDKEAMNWASAALKLAPDRQSAKRVMLISSYNLAASGDMPASRAFWQAQADTLKTLSLDDERLAFIDGLAQWNIGNANQAVARWKEAYDRWGLKASASRAALAAVTADTTPLAVDDALVSQLSNGRHPILACVAARHLHEPERTAFLQRINLSPDAFKSISASIDRVLPMP